MHPGVADAAEGDKVDRIVVCRVQVDVMDVKLHPRAADCAHPAVTIENDSPDLPPAPKPVLRPRPDGNAELLAEDGALLPHGERAPAAETEEAVPIRAAVAEGGLRAVERIKAELQVGGHAGRSLTGCGISAGMLPRVYSFFSSR
ncbi:hypothetical protein ES707_17709 [subsurface metagenome]